MIWGSFAPLLHLQQRSDIVRYLGIDTSTIALPYSVFEDKYLFDFGNIKIKGNHITDKMSMAFDEIQSLIDKYQIDVVVLEDVFMGGNFQSAKSQAKMLGVLQLASTFKKCSTVTALATKWRKGIIKSGQKTPVKEQAVNYVNDVYDLDLEYKKSRTKTDDDIAEAILMVEGLVWERYTVEKPKLFSDKVSVITDGQETD